MPPEPVLDIELLKAFGLLMATFGGIVVLLLADEWWRAVRGEYDDEEDMDG